MINWLYNKFLWFLGFKVDSDPDVTGDEKITFMLRRQKQRFGKLWWLWAGAWIAFPIWLTLHILQVGGF
jgi:hypothetical protein